jgi:hypothetical protein
MGRNCERHPPRPRIELVTEPASEGEAAAIVAAMEQFLAETAPPPEAAGAPGSRWQRAALTEGVSARDLGDRAWGAGRGPGGLAAPARSG